MKNKLLSFCGILFISLFLLTACNNKPIHNNSEIILNQTSPDNLMQMLNNIPPNTTVKEIEHSLGVVLRPEIYSGRYINYVDYTNDVHVTFFGDPIDEIRIQTPTGSTQIFPGSERNIIHQHE